MADRREPTARHTGAGVARRAAFHERRREERAQLEANGGVQLEAEVENVELVSAATVLEGIAEVGPNYTLLRATETKKERRKRQREQAAAKQQLVQQQAEARSAWGSADGHVEDDQWQVEALLATREVAGRTEYLVRWAGWTEAHDSWEDEEDVSDDAIDEFRASQALEQRQTRSRTAPSRAGTEQAAGGATTAAAAADAQVGAARGGVPRSALARALQEGSDDEEEEEAQRADDEPLLSPHGYDLSKALRYVRRRLRDYLAEEAEAGRSVKMQRTANGLHPTMRWTIQFGKWLATTRIRQLKASAWHFQMPGDARAEEVVARTGRGHDSVYVALQHMKNHVWQELWPAMPTDARQYWKKVTHHVTSLFDGGGGGMKDAAERAGRFAGRVAAEECAAAGGSSAQQQAASEAASAAMRKQTEAELRAGTTKPLAREHLHQTGEYQMQDTKLSEPFEVNESFVLNAYMCFARHTGCRPGMAVNDKADAADVDGFW